MKNEYPLITGGDATGSIQSLAIDLTNWTGSWSIQVDRSASDGAPTVDIECSNNGDTYKIYKDMENVDVTNGEIFIDGEFIPRFLRISYTSNSATGTVDAIFIKV